MTSIQIQIRKTDKDFTDKASTVIKGEDNLNWFLIPLWFKKIDDGLFAEYSIDDLPETIKQQINKTKTVY